MYVDASAIVAILAQEGDADLLLLKLEASQTPRYVSPLAVHEATIALAAVAGRASKTPVTADTLRRAREAVEEFVSSVEAEEILVSADIGRKAIDAAARFGRIVGHRADLNFGDCFSYAFARAYRVPLLYKGNDFSQTDVND